MSQIVKEDRETIDIPSGSAQDAISGAKGSEKKPEVAQIVEPTLEERVIQIDRVSRTRKGGRRIRFRALVAVGDRQSRVGIGVGKAGEITSAVAKATSRAKRNFVTIPIVRQTIPHEVRAKFDAAIVLLKPARVGTSVIAGSSIRPILELGGVENVVAKCLSRTTSKLNNAYATMAAIRQLREIVALPPRPYRPRRKSKTPSGQGEAPRPKESPVIRAGGRQARGRASKASPGRGKKAG